VDVVRHDYPAMQLIIRHGVCGKLQCFRHYACNLLLPQPCGSADRGIQQSVHAHKCPAAGDLLGPNDPILWQRPTEPPRHKKSPPFRLQVGQAASVDSHRCLVSESGSNSQALARFPPRLVGHASLRPPLSGRHSVVGGPYLWGRHCCLGPTSLSASAPLAHRPPAAHAQPYSQTLLDHAAQTSRLHRSSAPLPFA